MSGFGPFSVEPAQLTRLGGARFGAIATRLLALETARAGMAGSTLGTTYIDNLGDEGVDAGIHQATATRWIPAGESAWQFKAGDLSPASCAKELRGASKALAVLRAGGKYRLVLGASRTDAMIESRRKALEDQAVALGITVENDTIKVFTADSLARWAEDYPALAVDPLLGGMGTSGMTFESWSSAVPSTRTLWATSAQRDKIIDDLRTVIDAGTRRELRVEGVSGVGKTRLVLETLRDQPYESLVVYIPSADQFTAPLLNHLASDGRTAIIIIDACDRKQHEIFTAALTAASTTRLITIGEPSTTVLRSNPVTVRGLDREAMEALLAFNAPELPTEARRVVVEVAAGNIDYALQAADAVGRNVTSAGTLVTVNAVKTFIAGDLPKGKLFVASTALALFTRFGFDGEVGAEIATIASGLGVPEADLRSAAHELDHGGLLSKQGRYRSVAPFPVAVYLAKAGWDEFGGRIVSGLIPTVDDELIERLFRRAADIGEFDSGEPAVSRFLPPGGAFADLAALGSVRVLLSHLAVITPVVVSERLGALIDSATDKDLVSHAGIRRDLVWALGKLAWNSETFERAAESLLRLALAETEDYANNATGTWKELFGTFLPATAASPETRIGYLAEVAEHSDPQARLLAAQAASGALDLYASIIVSSELQGGRVVEPRGSATFAEAAPYMSEAIDILKNLTEDPDGAVAASALKRLVAAIPRVMDFEPVRRHLATVLGTLSPSGVRAVRAQIAGVRALDDDGEEAKSRRLLIDEIDAALPAASSRDELWVLAHSNAWDFDDDTLLERLRETVWKLDAPAAALLELIAMPETLEAAFEVGRALAELGGDTVLPELENAIDTPNFPALLGYLRGRVAAGDTDVFDRFVDNASLTDAQAIALTVHGPHTARADERVAAVVSGATVAQGARALRDWAREADEQEILRYVQGWEPRLETQEDYHELLDFVSLHVRRLGDDVPALDVLLLPLVARRSQFPGISRHHYQWDRLAARAAVASPAAMAAVFADLVEANQLSIFGRSSERKALEDAVRLGGPPVWALLMGRMENGDWRLKMFAGGWLAEAAGLDVARSWIGNSVERARLVASVATVGESQVTPIARYLLEKFAADKKIAAILSDRLDGYGWSGNQSDHITRQIDTLQAWMANDEEPRAVKSWARKLVVSLRARRKRALDSEAEESW